MDNSKSQLALLRAALGTVTVSVDTLINLIINSKNPDHALEVIMGIYEEPTIAKETPKGVFISYNPWMEGCRQVRYQPASTSRYTSKEGLERISKGYQPHRSSETQCEHNPFQFTYTPCPETTSLEDWNKG